MQELSPFDRIEVTSQAYSAGITRRSTGCLNSYSTFFSESVTFSRATASSVRVLALRSVTTASWPRITPLFASTA